MRYPAIYLIYIAVILRAIGWNYETETIPYTIWILLIIFGVILVTEQRLTRHFRLYPRFYTLVQSVLVVSMIYSAPTLDFLPMLFFPLSFQSVYFFHTKVGFAWIAGFILAISGLLLFGMEWQAGVTMVLAGGGANIMMGGFAHLIKRTEQRRLGNQRLFAELQGAYSQLKNSADQAEAIAAAEERHRLARELHDSLTQTLFSMNLAVQSAYLSIQEDPHQAEKHLTHLHNMALNAASEVQTLTQPPIQGGLVSMIQQLVKERLAQDGLQVVLNIREQRSLPEYIEINLFRIAQEAINNITRHAGVHQAQLKLDLENSVASLEVLDQGCGFDLAESAKGKGFGLKGIAERVKEIGWELEIQSQPGKGTYIRVKEKRS
jgi:signal transduction histidine kinase